MVDSYLRGAIIPYRKPFVSKRTVTAENFKDRERKPRVKVTNRPAEERKHDFEPVNAGFTPEEAMKEASRCLECGCHDYYDCRLIRFANQFDVKPERFAGEVHDREDVPVVRDVIVHDPGAARPHDLDDPFLDPAVQSRIGDVIANKAVKHL